MKNTLTCSNPQTSHCRIGFYRSSHIVFCVYLQIVFYEYKFSISGAGSFVEFEGGDRLHGVSQCHIIKCSLQFLSQQFATSMFPPFLLRTTGS